MLNDRKQMIAATKFEQQTLISMLDDGDVVNDPMLTIRESKQVQS